MEGNHSFFEVFQKVVDALTIKRIFMTLLIGILGTVVTLLFENRSAIFQAVYNNVYNKEESTLWDVSDESKRQLVSFVSEYDLINFALINDVNLQKNRKTPKFWFAESGLSEKLKGLDSTMPSPVFDFDEKNTQQMVGVLNNEFVCIKFADSTLKRDFAFAEKDIPVICRHAIPPFYGKFVGILTLGLKRMPSSSEMDALKLSTSKISIDIYLRDVLKKPTSA